MKVLLVEDSRTVAAYLTAVLREAPDFDLLPPARDGREGVRAALRYKPDVILMDLQLPEMDGIDAIRQILSSQATPIVVLSAFIDSPQGDRTFEAFSAGAVDVLPKPRGQGETEHDLFKRRLFRTLRTMAQACVVRRGVRLAGFEPALARAPTPPGEVRSLLLVGASTGGPMALSALLSGLPSLFRLPILISQHIVPGFEPSLARWLSQTGHPVEVVDSTRCLEQGRVYLSTASADMVLTSRGVSTAESRGALCPSVDRLFSSAVPRAPGVIAVLLTGMGEDGARGLLALREAGALTIAQDGPSCVVDGMPGTARSLGAALATLAPRDIAPFVLAELSGCSP